MRGPAKIAGSKMGSKTCPTCKGTGKVPVKTRPKPMSASSKSGSGSKDGPGGRGGPGDRSGKGKGPGGPGRSRA